MNHPCRALAALLLLCTSGPLPAESLQGALKGELVPDGPPLMIGLDEVAVVSLPAGNRFLKALEIEITIPREVFPYRSNLAVFVYQNFVQGKAGSSGDRMAIEVLPPAAKFYLQAPLVAKAGLRAAVDTAVLKLPKFDGAFPLALTILPIDKELPPGWESFQFSVRTRSQNANLGALVIHTPTLSDEDRKRLRITANGLTQAATGPLLLEPGPYTIQVSLPGEDPAETTAVVTQAKTTEVTFDLTPEDPTLVVEAPEGTLLVIDGKRIAWKPATPLPVERGSHQVQFLLGDTVISDTFTVTRGGRHRLSLSLAVGFSHD